MKLIGLAGAARSGKDTVAQWLVANHGYLQFSFSDALYREVSQAFRVSVEFLQDAAIKDSLREEMALKHCFDGDFVQTALRIQPTVPSIDVQDWHLSPRWILQTWGTEYRRHQDPDYWIKRAYDWMHAEWTHGADKFVNSSVRYPNECEWIRSMGGEVWHISRPDCPVVRAHSSEVPVPFVAGDKVLVNGATIDHLHQSASKLLTSPYDGVAVFGPQGATA